jgi:hypothetical protein
MPFARITLSAARTPARIAVDSENCQRGDRVKTGGIRAASRSTSSYAAWGNSVCLDSVEAWELAT